MSLKTDEDERYLVHELLVDRRFPTPWYQDYPWLPTLVGGLAGGLLIALNLLFWGLSYPLWIKVGGVLILLILDGLDVYTTHLLFRLEPQFSKRGIELPYYEANPWLPAKPRLNQLVWGIPQLFSLLAMVVTFVFPPMLLAFGLDWLVVPLSNYRNYRQAEYELRLHDKMALLEKSTETPLLGVSLRRNLSRYSSAVLPVR